jgi:hypothetical protein
MQTLVPQPPLKGSKALIVGVANEHLIAQRPDKILPHAKCGRDVLWKLGALGGVDGIGAREGFAIPEPVECADDQF